MRVRSFTPAIALAAITITTLAGCSTTGEDSAASSTATIGPVDLSDVCPSTIVIQTDWNPSSEHGHLYEMLGPDPVIDSSAKAVRGELYSKGSYTGVELEIRAGGPAIGYQSVSSQMYSDESITLGYVQTDGQILSYQSQPTTSVFAPLDVSPQILMWDPATYPDVTTIEQLGKTGAIVRYTADLPYMAYLIDSGILEESRTDSGYDGTPAGFVAADGADAQQGFASSDPYVYENEVTEWGKPVAYQLVADAGYPNYTATVSIRTDRLPSLDACLTKLVPIMQQAEVDFYSNPDPVVDLIVKTVEEYGGGFVYTTGAAQYGVTSVIDNGLVSNGNNGTIGDFDPERIQQMIDIVASIDADRGTATVDELMPEDLYTNKYIDPSIGLDDEQ